MNTHEHQFMWIDFETTGLDPSADVPLEFAVLLVADGPGGDMSVVESYTAPIAATSIGAQASLQNMDPYVRNMHTRNGLLDAIAGPDAVPLDDVDALLAGLCMRLGAKPRQVRLAGASVHFDLGFARAHLPTFAGFLSHRILDVSTLVAAEKCWGIEIPATPREVHRALPDILATLNDAAIFRARRYGAAK